MKNERGGKANYRFIFLFATNVNVMQKTIHTGMLRGNICFVRTVTRGTDSPLYGHARLFSATLETPCSGKLFEEVRI